MKHILCIDPGLAADNGTGWAHFITHFIAHSETHMLAACGLVQGIDAYPLPRKCRDIVRRVEIEAEERHYDTIIVEHMHIYPVARMKGDGNQLIDLAYLEGAFQTIPSHDTKLVQTSEWKGQVPEKIMRERIKRSLTQAERETVERTIKDRKLNAKEAMNVWVACGIGLHHVSRLR